MRWVRATNDHQLVCRTDGGGYYVVTNVLDEGLWYYELEANGRLVQEQFMTKEAAQDAALEIEEKRK